jgi:hypothetical protein
LGKLMTQFKIERRDPRKDASFSVRMTATDFAGLPLDQEVTAVNISWRGAQLKGVGGKLRVGSEISLFRQNQQEQFRVEWVGGGSRTGLVGVSTINPTSSFWNDVLGARSQPGLADADQKRSAPRNLKSKAQGA